MKSSALNLNAENNSGARANISYGNIFDQKRYFNALNFIREKDVLDCACGIGWGSCLLANGGAKSVVGVDLSPNAIESAERFYSANNLKFTLGTADDIDSDIKFDVITSFETLEHVDDPIVFLKSLKARLKPGGLLLLSTPNGFCFKNDKDRPYNPYHIEEYTKDELLRLLDQSGWVVDKYMGQKPMKADSQDVINYRNFIRSYWRTNKYSDKFGFLYRILHRLFSEISPVTTDTSPRTGVNPEPIEEGYEPAFHFIIAS